MENERRKFKRKNSDFVVSYKVISPPDGNGNATGIDISEAGISLPIRSLLCPGIILELEFNLGVSRESIVTTGEVIWVKERNDENFPYIIGIKFINIATRDKDRIYYHIHREAERKTKQGEGEPPGVGWIE